MSLIQNMLVMAKVRRLAATVIVMAAGSFCAYGGDVVGKVVVGYQGWLSAPNDGSLVSKWKHTNLECWPDVREYTTTFSGCTFYQAGVLQSAFNGNLGNGQPARMFSNWSDQTVNKHFEWMQQYEIDCAAVQRFGSELGDSAMKAYRDGIAAKVRTAAAATGRKYYIMYDISGWTSFQSEIKTDWSNVMRAHTNSSAYAKENGKPVVCIWGIGFSDRPGNVTSWTDVVNWFKGQGCYVIGGVKDKFASDTTNKNAYKACNMLMAWRVGKTSSFDTAFSTDLSWCNANGVAYQGAIYPGTAFYNTDPSKPKNQIKRLHGNFMWSQFAAARLKNVKSVYISMFDEVQEATQIFKAAENSSMIPAGKYFLTLDADGVACSSDFYLRLTRDGVKMVKAITPYVTAHPTAHVASSLTTVPWVTNLTQAAAGTAITNAGLVVSSVNSEYHATVAAGKIFSQTPGGNTSADVGSSVALAVSLGPQPTTTTVPWVTNLTQAAAGNAITNAGLVVSGVNSEYHATVAAGRVFSQTPGGNTTVNLGSSVALAVSLGPQPQLVVNGSFEVDTASWTLAGSGVVRSTTSAAEGGLASLRINMASSSAKQTIAIVPGTTYDISVHVYVPTRSGGMVVFDTWDSYDAAGQGQFVFSATNGGWQEYAGSFTATNSSVTVRMFSDSAFVGTAYFDQIELKPRP